MRRTGGGVGRRCCGNATRAVVPDPPSLAAPTGVAKPGVGRRCCGNAIRVVSTRSP